MIFTVQRLFWPPFVKPSQSSYFCPEERASTRDLRGLLLTLPIQLMNSCGTSVERTSHPSKNPSLFP
uniref:Uncharacterized protein n=1 Tax=Sander lucioperca TaxID=283035 RepID=A0A8D0AGV5_SANLU